MEDPTVIFASTAELLADLAHSGVVYIGLTFIGKGSFKEYVDALKRSHIHRLLPIIVVVTRRESKAILAKRIGASIAFDDQYDHIARYGLSKQSSSPSLCDAWTGGFRPGGPHTTRGPDAGLF